MTTEKIIAIAKEKFNKDLTQEEAQAYLDRKLPIPDEALELVSGGKNCGFEKKDKPSSCSKCGSSRLSSDLNGWICADCGHLMY